MKFKLFGKDLFEFRTAKSDMLWVNSNNAIKESKYLPDFHVTSGNTMAEISNYAILEQVDPNGNRGAVAVPIKDKAPDEERIEITPKGLYALRALNDDGFKLNTDPEYIDKQLATFKDKLNLITSEEYDMRRGVDEISSVILRLENRKKYEEVKEYFEPYAYTTTSKINDVLKGQDHLKLGQVAQFFADMPKEAVEAMKHYEAGCKKLCNKKPVFYIIANKKDFKKTEKRRDPILLAQSPFGHIWQILGAWDEEMILLESL